jgi:hypothetical protein
MDINVIGCEDIYWIQDGDRWRALVNIALNVRVA